MKHLFLNNSSVLILNLTLIHDQAAAFKLGVLVLMTKVTLFRWRYFIFINLMLLISNLSITF